LRRAYAVSQRVCGLSSLTRKSIGIHMSMFCIQGAVQAPAGITPTIVPGFPPYRRVRPRTSRAPPNRRCHNPSLMIRERFPGTASSRVKTRPRTGVMPSSENAPGVRNCIVIRSSAPSPDSVLASAYQTMPSIQRDQPELIIQAIRDVSRRR
jgi:hypothetical protein